MNKIIL